ncbi:hypothetical protein [Winogradskyella sp. R77965]|uniref:hypothetical protein n=1 Tax=Winogradskyella sp. R77965 TaxID=3093872 RepID=UPI0037DD506F
MKTIITLTLMLFCISAIAQKAGTDYLVTVKNDTIHCEIVQLKNKKITYIENGQKGKKKKNIFKFADVHFSNPSIIKNPLNIKIEKPDSGYAYVYLYRPYVYTGAALACKVEYNGESFINIKTHSYFVHKVKANEVHKYNTKSAKKDVLEINAKEGEIYFIRGSFGGTGEAFVNNLNTSNTVHIFEDNPKVASSVILTMKKVSPKY